MKDTVSNRYVTIYLFVLLFSVYLFTASGINANIGDVAILRLAVAKSIIERCDISVSAPAEIVLKGSDGRAYSQFSIGSVLIALPFYAVSKLAGVPPENVIGIINQLAGAITTVVVFMFCLSLGYTRRASLYVSICYGLGTFAWYYAKEPGDHAIETLFSILSVYFMHRYSTYRRIPYLLLSSVALGFAFLTRPTSLMLIPPLMIQMVLPHKSVVPIRTALKTHFKNTVLYFSLLLPFAGIFFWYNFLRFGSIFETGYTLLAARLGFKSFFTATPLLTGLLGFMESPGKGFFYYSPIALLFMLSFRPFCKKHPGTAISFTCIIISYLLFFSKFLYWHGDWAWGPRYLSVVTPFMIIPLAELFDSSRWDNDPLFKQGILALFVLSMAIQLMSVSIHVYNYFKYLQDEKVAFNVARGDGAPEISEPAPDTYFNWRYAPILTQPKLMLSAGRNLTTYSHNANTIHAYKMKNIRSQPWLNVFDFWWLYKYYLENSFTGFIAAFVLLLLSATSAMKLFKAIA